MWSIYKRFKNTIDIFEHLDACVSPVLERAEAGKHQHNIDSNKTPSILDQKQATDINIRSTNICGMFSLLRTLLTTQNVIADVNSQRNWS